MMSGPDLLHPVKPRAVSAALRARGLDRLSLARRGLLMQVRQVGSDFAPVGCVGVLLVTELGCLPFFRPRRSATLRSCHTLANPADRRLRSTRRRSMVSMITRARRYVAPAPADPTPWTVTDDWPEDVPVTEAEIEVFEAWFGDLFDEFSLSQRRHRRISARCRFSKSCRELTSFFSSWRGTERRKRVKLVQRRQDRVS